MGKEFPNGETGKLLLPLATEVKLFLVGVVAAESSLVWVLGSGGGGMWSRKPRGVVGVVASVVWSLPPICMFTVWKVVMSASRRGLCKSARTLNICRARTVLPAMVPQQSGCRSNVKSANSQTQTAVTDGGYGPTLSTVSKRSLICHPTWSKCFQPRDSSFVIRSYKRV